MSVLHLSDCSSPNFLKLYESADLVITTGDLDVMDIVPILRINLAYRKPAFGIYGNHDAGNYVTTPPDKSGGLLKLRMTHPSTLTLEGSVQAHFRTVTAFYVLRAELLRTAAQHKVGKVQPTHCDPEPIMLLTSR